jgi:hypothetical protein
VLQSISSSQLTLGALAVASQRKPVSRSTIQPYTVSGTYSAGTSAAAGTGYTYDTDTYYSGQQAYLYESDERSTPAPLNMSASDANVSGIGGRNGIYKLASTGNCDSRPNGATGTPTGTNYSAGYQTYCSVYGPDVYSEPFYVGAGMSLAFDWAAQKVQDDYEIYGYLIALSDLADVTYADSDYSVVTHAIGRGVTSAASASWSTASAAITSPGYHRFRFVNGTYDATGGLAIGSNMYIDPQAVIVAKTNVITFPALADIVGAATSSSTTVTLSSTAGGTVSVVSSTTGVCTVTNVGNVYTIVKGATDGICILTASQGATGEYAPATTVVRSFEYLATAAAPAVATGLSSSVSASGATLNGTVTPRGAATDGSFCYGTASDLTGCTPVAITPQVSATDPATAISTSITGLLASTTYCFRASGVNSAGTTNGLILSFTTSAGSGGGGSGGGSTGGGGAIPEPTPTPTPTPTPVVSPAALPTLDPVVIPVTDAVRPGGSAILVGGVPVATAVAPNASSTGLTVSGPDWSLGLGAVTPEGRPAPLGRGGVVDARTGTSLAVSGVSFAPGTQVKVYILAPPMTLGTLTVNADGTFSGRVSLPLTLSPGSYTVQVNGYSPTMSLRSASLGIGLQSSAKSVVKRIKRTVYFDRLSSRLTPKSKKVIAAAVRQVTRAATNVSVQMVAYVQREDYRGNDFILSAKRAKIVGASLKAKGVKGRYYESGRGRATQGGSKARRTEIVIAYTIKR